MHNAAYLSSPPTDEGTTETRKESFGDGQSAARPLRFCKASIQPPDDGDGAGADANGADAKGGVMVMRMAVMMMMLLLMMMMMVMMQ